jgi:hypothetical protein
MFAVLAANNTKQRYLMPLSAVLYLAAQALKVQATGLHLLFRYIGYISLQRALRPWVSLQELVVHSGLYFGHILHMTYRCSQYDTTGVSDKDFQNTLCLARFEHTLIVATLILLKYN